MADRRATFRAEGAIEEACQRAEQWYRELPQFENRVNLGSVVGFRHPAIVSEHDCVIRFARFLNEAGVPWDAMHHQVSVSRWLFDAPHPGATKVTPEEKRKRWRVDLAILESEQFRTARLPATEHGFRFDAFLEFAYLDDSWTMPGAHPWGEPAKRRNKVRADVDKIARYLSRDVCQSGYVIVFEECDWGFSPTFALDAELSHGCKVRFLRGYSRTCPECGAEATLPIVWGLPGPELQRLEREGKIVLGGCLVDGDDRDPEWECERCKHRWRS